MHTHTLPYPIPQVHQMAEMFTEKMVQGQIDQVMIQKIAENPELAALLEIQNGQFYPEMPPDWNNDKRAKEELLSWGMWSFADPLFPAFLYQQAQKLQPLQKLLYQQTQQAKMQSLQLIGVLMVLVAFVAKMADWSSFETVLIAVLLAILVKLWEIGDAMSFMKVMIAKIANGTDHIRYCISSTGGNQVKQLMGLHEKCSFIELRLQNMVGDESDTQRWLHQNLTEPEKFQDKMHGCLDICRQWVGSRLRFKDAQKMEFEAMFDKIWVKANKRAVLEAEAWVVSKGYAESARELTVAQEQLRIIQKVIAEINFQPILTQVV